MLGILYIVSTPIGNLEDITLRALNILREIDCVAAEDTRRTLPLLSHFGIRKKVLSYFEHSRQKRQEEIVHLLQEGKNVALVSDAGTPTLSDPGVRLVAACHSLAIPVVPIPGPCAVVAALSVAGVPTEPFHFWGFLPPTRSKRLRIYQTMQSLEGSHGLYESSHRLIKRVEEWRDHFSDFYFLVAREMTKKFEEFIRGPFPGVAERISSSPVRGEYTIILSRETF